MVAAVAHTYERTATEIGDGRLASVFGSHLGGPRKGDDRSLSTAAYVRVLARISHHAVCMRPNRGYERGSVERCYDFCLKMAYCRIAPEVVQRDRPEHRLGKQKVAQLSPRSHRAHSQDAFGAEMSPLSKPGYRLQLAPSLLEHRGTGMPRCHRYPDAPYGNANLGADLQ